MVKHTVVEHSVEIIAGAAGFRWKCSCKQDGGGQWHKSEEEALKSMSRHLKKQE